MSIQAVAWALEQDLPARPKLVLVSIANHANHTDGYCWLKAETIASEAACTPRSVYRFIGGLVRNGYLRKSPKKGDDGKQRANDYWMLLDREAKPWDWGAHPDEADAGEDGTDDSATVDPEPQDVVEPTDTVSHGETPEPDDTGVLRQPVDEHAVSCGPYDSRVSRKRIAEPSESNSKASSAGARVRDVALRSYRPPPPPPLGADPELPTKQVFVYENSRAYDAWTKRKSAEMGIRNWHLVTRANIDGQWRTGWYFPTLFPPPEKPKEATEQGKTGPPPSAT